MKENTICCLDRENLEGEEQEELNCNICLQFMLEPSRTNCGHVFGDHCIKRWRQGGFGNCPLCREKISELTVDLELKEKADLLQGLCRACEMKLPTKELQSHLMICQKTKAKKLAVLREIVARQKALLDIEINPHLFQFHGEIYETYVRNWEWLMFDEREYKWWWYKKNAWWNNKGCEQCQQLIKIYDEKVERVESRRVDLIKEMGIKTVQDTEIQE